jgi:hypothetical protein
MRIAIECRIFAILHAALFQIFLKTLNFFKIL